MLPQNTKPLALTLTFVSHYTLYSHVNGDTETQLTNMRAHSFSCI